MHFLRFVLTIFKYGSEKRQGDVYCCCCRILCGICQFWRYDFSEVSQLSGAFAVFAENPIYMVVLAVCCSVISGVYETFQTVCMKREL